MPQIQTKSTPQVLEYLQALKTHGFTGDIRKDIGTRVTHSVDNSVYQLVPQAVIFPKVAQDLNIAADMLTQFNKVRLTPKGGGTSTNGQCLSTDIIIDCSKYLNEISEIDIENKTVTVQPGVVLDTLNRNLKALGFFFAPHCATGSRATIGGMVSTDAAGQGSAVYGKTSNHVVEIDVVLSDGQTQTLKPVATSKAKELAKQDSILGKAYRQALETTSNFKPEIKQQFPKLTRFMTGYDLFHCHNDKTDTIDLSRLVCGAEGTLGLIQKIKLTLTPIPKFKALFVLKYSNFHAALSDAMPLAKFKPSAIETMNKTLMTLGMTDISFEKVKEFFPKTDSSFCINLVEFSENSMDELQKKIMAISQHLEEAGSRVKPGMTQDSPSQLAQDPRLREDDTIGEDDTMSYSYTCNEEDIQNLWNLRKKSAGMLTKGNSKRKPVSGLEDTVVPPEKLADFIQDFTKILDGYKLTYGMFGHVDAGCLHVRPALDMTDSKDEAIYHQLTDQVAELVQQYGGVMWGEHGKGLRSEYVPMFFGETLYPELQKIKFAFDPFNQLNPGKITVPTGSTETVIPLNSAKRGHTLKTINPGLAQEYEGPVGCNGNGVCFNDSETENICPSFKATRDRVHSPKGRSMLIQTWLQDTTNQKVEQATYDALEGCLSCKACLTECPVNVNIPKYKALFMQHYFQKHRRKIKDIVIAKSEALLHKPSFRWLYKALGGRFSSFVGLQHLPSLNLSRINEVPITSLENLPKQAEDNSIVIIQDWLTHFFDSPTLLIIYELILKLGFKVYVLPLLEHGKSKFEKGYVKEFNQIAQKNAAIFQEVQNRGFTMVGIDPSLTLSYRHEYVDAAKHMANIKILQLQEFLSLACSPAQEGHPDDSPSQERHPDDAQRPSQQDRYSPSGRDPRLREDDNIADSAPTFNGQTKHFYLFSHCTESALQPLSATSWQTIFSHFGKKLHIVKTGCCGMAGSYGMETSNQAESRKLYELSWEKALEDLPVEQIVATGFSCRQQALQLSELKLKHPAEVL